MELDLTPLEWDWTPVTKGDTFPSIRIQETSSEVDCARVRVKIKASGVATAALELDSDASGITITDGTAGAWDFTIDTITGLRRHRSLLAFTPTTSRQLTRRVTLKQNFAALGRFSHKSQTNG